MAGTVVATILLALGVLPQVSIATEGLVRKEQHLAQLSPHGDAQLIREGPERTQPEKTVGKLGTQYCDKDFVGGELLTSNCGSGQVLTAGQQLTNIQCTEGAVGQHSCVHSLISDKDACIEAADQMGVTRPTHGNIDIDIEDIDKRPHGCFKKEPTDCPGNLPCFQMNGEWDQHGAAEITMGTPVCTRFMHLNGTEDTNGDCPDGYRVLATQNECISVATCIAIAMAEDPVVGSVYGIPYNGSKHLDYPQGCFIGTDNREGAHRNGFSHVGRVLWNESPAGLGVGTSGVVKGIPICVVATPFTWPSA